MTSVGAAAIQMVRTVRREKQYDVVVIGAGAGGMMAAGRAAEAGAGVLLLEKMDRPGKKIRLTGKKRCNLSNVQDLKGFVAMFGENGPFLYRALHEFPRESLLSLLRDHGLETKVERGGRIFPVTDNAGDVLRVLRQYVGEHGADLHTGVRVTGLATERGRISGVQTEQGDYPAKAVVLATGGAAFPQTGSSGDGYRMVTPLGHTIVKVRPSLVPLVVQEIDLASSMQGVSLRHVRMTAFACPAEKIDIGQVPPYDVGRGLKGRKSSTPILESRQGEMMLTHFGMGGPITLLMSLSVVDALEKGPVSVSIDLKPGLSFRQLHERLQRDFSRHGKRSFRRIMEGLVPRKMVEPLVGLSGVDAGRPANQISAAEREKMVMTLKSLRFNIAKPLPLSRAVVTAGGVSLREIDPRTMASLKMPGLYFCGEVMDIDADTGGYNLQAAFSTGWLAGESAARFVRSH